MVELNLSHIYKKYPNSEHYSVEDFNLDIKDKEFIVFVGPSGCGKSTTLRMIAGLEDITEGECSIDGTVVNNVAPKDRDIAMVFQSYALYPHMSVYDNMAFGLKLKKMPKEEIDKRVKEAAKILEIEEYLKRKPKALSGGQRQRVALGRAIVRNAKVFLMDEPLSNLDAKLRVQMRSEIIKLHEKLGATTIYVTHDQTEAMTMASRIVVMKDGYIQQIGTPKEIYNHPVNMFVASFVGSPAMNFIPGKIEKGAFCTGNYRVQLPMMYAKALQEAEGRDVVFGIRPEDLHCEGIVAETYPSSSFDFEVDVCELLGHELILHGALEGCPLVAKVSARTEADPHSHLSMAMDLSKIHLFDQATEKAI